MSLNKQHRTNKTNLAQIFDRPFTIKKLSGETDQKFPGKLPVSKRSAIAAETSVKQV